MESQNIEYKESWRDEYLKWICGFANAQGGTLYIGVDDNGEVVGLNDVKKLSEDIPNKVRDKLGIVVEVNLLEKNDLAYLEIITQPSAFPINFNGEYHYRSGSTKQLLQGAALTQFLFDKTGMTWDCVLMNDLTVKDFRDEEFELFKEQAIRSHRMDKKDLDMDNEQILNHLGLIKEGKIMRAAMMLFHKNPEKWINGSYVKIGFFETDADLRYYDEIHGSLISQAEKTIDLLYTKYMKAEISYEGVTRIETYPFPKEAIREAVYNALVHKNYAKQIPIQISVYADKLYIGNDCVFLANWTKDTLLGKHRSLPYNPNIARGFFWAGYIETWGRGIEKICEACDAYGTPRPEYTVYPEDIMVMFKAKEMPINVSMTNGDGIEKCPDNVLINVLKELTDRQRNIYYLLMNTGQPSVMKNVLINVSETNKTLAEKYGLNERTIRRDLMILQQKGLVRHVGPNKTGHWEIVKPKED